MTERETEQVTETERETVVEVDPAELEQDPDAEPELE